MVEDGDLASDPPRTGRRTLRVGSTRRDRTECVGLTRGGTSGGRLRVKGKGTGSSVWDSPVVGVEEVVYG